MTMNITKINQILILPAAKKPTWAAPYTASVLAKKWGGLALRAAAHG